MKALQQNVCTDSRHSHREVTSAAFQSRTREFQHRFQHCTLLAATAIGQAPATLRSTRGWLISSCLVLYHVASVRSHVIALRRRAQDPHQCAADYNAAALALFTALLLFHIPHCTTIIQYTTVICSWTARTRASNTSTLQRGAYTKNASITRLRFDAVHAGLWRTPHEVESGKEARCTSEYPTDRVKPMR